MYAGGVEEALEQLAAAGLSQRCGTLGSVASGVGRRWPVQEGLPRRNGRREVGGTNVFYRVLVYPVGEGFGDFKNLALNFSCNLSLYSYRLEDIVIFNRDFQNPQGFKVQTGSKPSRLPVQSSSDEAARQEETTPRQPARARNRRYTRFFRLVEPQNSCLIVLAC